MKTWRLERCGEAWLWLRDASAEAVAEKGPDGHWTVREAVSDRLHFELVPVPGRAALGLVDAHGRVLGVVTPRGLRDATGVRVLAVRDSPLGLHVVGADGTVLAVGSHSEHSLELVVADSSKHHLIFAVALCAGLLWSATAA